MPHVAALLDGLRAVRSTRTTATALQFGKQLVKHARPSRIEGERVLGRLIDLARDRI